jgi:hypothetical protein
VLPDTTSFGTHRNTTMPHMRPDGVRATAQHALQRARRASCSPYLQRDVDPHGWRAEPFGVRVFSVVVVEPAVGLVCRTVGRHCVDPEKSSIVVAALAIHCEAIQHHARDGVEAVSIIHHFAH